MSALSAMNTEEDLPKVWAEIIARCNKITSWDLNESGNVTIDQVLAKINPPKQKSSAAKEEAKLVFKKTLVCVQRFGSFAAQTASMVFGPSQQCFNAISFVINAIQDYDEVFNNITALMERVSVFMDKLRVYLDNPNTDVKLDKRLRPKVYRVLEHFLVIMGKSHKLTRGWKGKLKLAVKVGAFGEDDGIKDAMAKLETWVSDIVNQEISIIVSELSDAARNIRGVDKKVDVLVDAAEKTISGINTLNAAEERRATAEQEQQDLDAVKKALGIKDSEKQWTDRQTLLWDNHVAGTGQWLLNFRLPAFARWANPGSPSPSSIAVKAPSGYGKTYLSSIVVNRLLDLHKDDQKVVIAYYYYPKDQDTTGKEEDKSEGSNAFNTAIKSLIWQLVSKYRRDYLKAVLKACNERAVEFANLGDVWRRLVTDPGRSLDVTFFIVLDGVENLDGDKRDALVNILQQIRSTEAATAPTTTANLKVRLFMTGTAEMLNPINEQSIIIPSIDITANSDTEMSSLNEADLHLVIEHRLKQIPRYNKDDPVINDLKEEIETKLSAGVRGNYSSLGYKLDEIANAFSTADVRAILERANETTEQEVAREIDRLNDSLSSAQILMVNRILAWMTTAYRALNVEQYANIVSIGADTSILISLEDEIENRYSGLFSVKDGTVQLRADEIKDYLIGLSDKQAKGNSTGFEKTEVDLIQRVIKTHFCNVFGADQDVYTRYKFDEFFKQKLADEEVRIHLTESEAQVTATVGCLAVICEKYDDPVYTPILEYANEWFADHLMKLDVDETDLVTKQDIGRKLVRALREPELIRGWWPLNRMFMTQHYVYRHVLTDTIFNWLADKDVQKGMPDMPTERQWVIDTTAEGSPSVGIFFYVAKIMAQHWFDNEDFWLMAFYWLRGYIALLAGEEADYSEEVVPIDATNDVEKFARTLLPDATDEFKWNTLMGLTHRTNKHGAEALERYNRALEANPDDWKLHYDIGKTHAGSDDYAHAVTAVAECIKKKDDLLNVDDEFTRSYWEDILLDVGGWNVELKELSAAETAYKELLDHGLELEAFEWYTMRATFRMAQVLGRQERHEDVIVMMTGLKDRRTEDSASWLTLFLDQYAWTDTFHLRLHGATKSIEAYQAVVDLYEYAIDELQTKTPEKITYLVLRLHLGCLKWIRGPKDEQEAILTMWETDFYKHVHDDADTYSLTLTYLQRTLSSALLDQAKVVGLSFPLSPEAEAYAKRLERLTWYDEPNSSNRQTKLLLARLYHLAGDTAHAKFILREFMKLAFEQAETKGSQHRAIRQIACALQVVDDDVNALAAWSLMQPFDPDAEDDDSEDGDGDSDSGDEAVNEDGEEDGDKDEPEDEDIEKEDEKKSSEAGVAKTETESGEATATSTVAAAAAVNVEEEPTMAANTDSTENNATAATTSEETKDNAAAAEGEETADNESQAAASDAPKPKLNGPLGDNCDGYCDVRWDYMDDIYICKDCLSVWFDPDCYAKLMAGTLENSVCGAHHSHLHVPAFDEVRWRSDLATAKDSVRVGDKLVPKKEWLVQLRKQWGLDEPSLKARARFVGAITRIQKSWRAFRGSTPPGTPRANTMLVDPMVAAEGVGRAPLKLVTAAA